MAILGVRLGDVRSGDLERGEESLVKQRIPTPRFLALLGMTVYHLYPDEVPVQEEVFMEPMPYGADNGLSSFGLPTVYAQGGAK